jgi:hypothetical protein
MPDQAMTSPTAKWEAWLGMVEGLKRSVDGYFLVGVQAGLGQDVGCWFALACAVDDKVGG